MFRTVVTCSIGALVFLAILALIAERHVSTASGSPLVQASTSTATLGTPSTPVSTASPTVPPTATTTPTSIPTATAQPPTGPQLLTRTLHATNKRGSMHLDGLLTVLNVGLERDVIHVHDDISWRHHRALLYGAIVQTRLDQKPHPTKRQRDEIVIRGRRAAERINTGSWQCETAKKAGGTARLRLPVKHPIYLGTTTVKGVAVWHVRGIIPASATGGQKALVDLYIARSDLTLHRYRVSAVTESSGVTVHLRISEDLSHFGEHIPGKLPTGCRQKAESASLGTTALPSSAIAVGSVDLPRLDLVGPQY